MSFKNIKLKIVFNISDKTKPIKLFEVIERTKRVSDNLCIYDQAY